jgi:hypothetical protein
VHLGSRHVGYVLQNVLKLNRNMFEIKMFRPLVIPLQETFALRGCIQKLPDWVDNELYAYFWYYSLRSNSKGYGHKTHYTDSKNSDTTASCFRELYQFQFSLQAASPETFGHTLVFCINAVSESGRSGRRTLRVLLCVFWKEMRNIYRDVGTDARYFH